VLSLLHPKAAPRPGRLPRNAHVAQLVAAGLLRDMLLKVGLQKPSRFCSEALACSAGSLKALPPQSCEMLLQKATPP